MFMYHNYLSVCGPPTPELALRGSAGEDGEDDQRRKFDIRGLKGPEDIVTQANGVTIWRCDGRASVGCWSAVV